MKKTIGALCLSLFGATTAMAHPGYQSRPHIHLTESVSIGIAVVLAIATSLVGIYLISKHLKKRKYAK